MTKRHGHPMFYELLEAMAALHSRKNHDYAGKADPLRNFKKAELQGIEPWRGVLLRMSDKWSRLESFAKQDTCMVEDETIEDTLLDNAIYSLLCIILRRERKEDKPVTVVDLTDHFKDSETLSKSNTGFVSGITTTEADVQSTPTDSGGVPLRNNNAVEKA